MSQQDYQHWELPDLQVQSAKEIVQNASLREPFCKWEGKREDWATILRKKRTFQFKLLN